MLLCFIIIHLFFLLYKYGPRVLSRQLTFNDNVLGRPLLVECSEAAVLTDTDNMLSEVEVLCIKAEQAEPQLPHRLSVLPVLWPATGLHVEEDKIQVLSRHGVPCIFTETYI